MSDFPNSISPEYQQAQQSIANKAQEAMSSLLNHDADQAAKTG